MSERMIPLKIADMAVESCNKEIAKLQAENVRLKGDINELADGLKLASEVGIKIADEVTRLKAENERLDTGIQPEGSNDAVGRAVELLLEKEKETARLQAEVERLRKAGDAMADCITEFRCGKYGNALNAIGGFKVFTEWLAAKEGNPSV